MLLAFLLGVGLSFMGSLQPGPSNVAVLLTARRYGSKVAHWVALGGSIPELLYCLVAFSCLQWLNQWLVFRLYFQIFTWGFLLFLLYRYFFVPPQTPNTPAATFVPRYWLLYGMGLAILNPGLWLYWMLTIQYCYEWQWLSLQNMTERLAFALGAMMGAWGLLFGVAQWTPTSKTT